MSISVLLKNKDGFHRSRPYNFVKTQSETLLVQSKTLLAQSETLLPFDNYLSGYFAPLASFPIKVNSGRYIEITIEPMVTPRKAISAGSINASKSAIAESTSSS